MWDKLLGLFKETYGDNEDYIPASIAKREARKQQLASSSQSSQTHEAPSERGQGTLIGYNYLKGLEDEDTMDSHRRFINLNNLLNHFILWPIR